MKRVLIVTLFLFGAFLATSSSASSAHAASIEGWLDNRAGSIPVTVTVNFFRSNESAVLPALVQTVSAGSRQFISKPDSSDLPPYRITWSTACNYGSQNNVTGSGGVYTFSDQDVHCTQVNANVSIVEASCPANTGSVKWRMVNVGSGGANVDYFRVYRALGVDAETDSSPITVDYVGQPQDERIQDLGTMGAGNWNVKIKAFTNPPDNNFDEESISINCGAGLVAPSPLNTNLSCASNQIRVDFSWGSAQSGTFNYLVQTNVNTDPGINGVWSGNSYTPNPSTIAVVTAQGSFNTSTTYFWRVRATRVSDGAVVNSGSANFTTPSTCSGASIQAPSVRNPNAMANVCAPNSVSYDWEIKNDENWQISNTNPDNVAFRWQRATPVSSIVANQEFVQVSTDASFLVGVNEFNVWDSNTSTSAAKVVNFAFVDNSQYFWRIKTRMNDGNWYFSEVKPFVPLASCTDVPHGCSGCTLFHVIELLAVDTYCLGTDSMVAWRWKTDGHSPLNPPSGLRIYVSKLGGGSPFGIAGSVSTTGYNDEFVANGWPDYLVGTYQTSIGKTNSSGQGVASSNNLSFTPRDCTQNSTVASPVGLDSVPTMSCSGANPTISFKWTDKSNNETVFLLDISTEQFTGDGTTNPNNLWGRKSVTPQGGGQPAQINHQHEFIWSNTNQLDVGDANPADVSTTLTPLEGTVYYWRVRAYVNSNTYSAYKYPDGSDNDVNAAGTVYASGVPFTSIICTPRYDLSLHSEDLDGDGTIEESEVAGFKNWTTQDFNANDTANLEITIFNRAPENSGIVNSVATTLYVYPSGAPLANCPTTAQPTPPVTTPPVVSFSVPPITAGGSFTVVVSFNVGSTPSSRTAQAYVTPSCAYSAGAELSTGWANNRTATGFTYTVGVDKFFETRGGDVGAVGTISTGVNSTDPNRSSGGPWPAQYQSQYLLAAGNLPDTTDSVYANGSPGSFRLDNYSNSIVNGDVYAHFYNRFRNQATTNICQSPAGRIVGGASGSPVAVNISGLNYCPGNLEITGDIDFNGVGVIFVDGYLDIRGDVLTGSADGVVFVVGGNIVLNTQYPFRVIRNLEGVFIARDSFYDSGQIFGGNSWAPSTLLVSENGNSYGYFRLRVKGAVYADGQAGPGFDLSRFYNTNIEFNRRYAVDIFEYDPKYLLIVSDLLSTTQLGWIESAP